MVVLKDVRTWWSPQLYTYLDLLVTPNDVVEQFSHIFIIFGPLLQLQGTFVAVGDEMSMKKLMKDRILGSNLDTTRLPGSIWQEEDRCLCMPNDAWCSISPAGNCDRIPLHCICWASGLTSSKWSFPWRSWESPPAHRIARWLRVSVIKALSAEHLVMEKRIIGGA